MDLVEGGHMTTGTYLLAVPHFQRPKPPRYAESSPTQTISICSKKLQEHLLEHYREVVDNFESSLGQRTDEFNKQIRQKTEETQIQLQKMEKRLQKERQDTNREAQRASQLEKKL
jgi:hypothetical protein